MSAARGCAALLVLALGSGCGGTADPPPVRERRTQKEVTARLGPLIERSARAIVPSARLVRGGFGGPLVVPCQDEGPVRTVSVSRTYVVANTAPRSSDRYVARATAYLTSHGFDLSYADRSGVAGRRKDGFVVTFGSSPSGRPSVTGATPCVPPTDPEHPVGL